jgi:predicted DCC family thiol-disulfide oxidoreductase YuxK
MESLPPRVSASDRVVLFDGECVMCSAGATFLLRVDKRRIFTLGTVQSPEGSAILAWHGLPTKTYTSFILCEGSRHYAKSAAFVRVVARLGFPWNLVAALWVVPRPVRDWLYDLVAKNRYRLFGKREHCIVLDPTDGARLLSTHSRGAHRDA